MKSLNNLTKDQVLKLAERKLVQLDSHGQPIITSFTKTFYDDLVGNAKKEFNVSEFPVDVNPVFSFRELPIAPNYYDFLKRRVSINRINKFSLPCLFLKRNTIVIADDTNVEDSGLLHMVSTTISEINKGETPSKKLIIARDMKTVLNIVKKLSVLGCINFNIKISTNDWSDQTDSPITVIALTMLLEQINKNFLNKYMTYSIIGIKLFDNLDFFPLFNKKAQVSFWFNGYYGWSTRENIHAIKKYFNASLIRFGSEYGCGFKTKTLRVYKSEDRLETLKEIISSEAKSRKDVILLVKMKDIAMIVQSLRSMGIKMVYSNDTNRFRNDRYFGTIFGTKKIVVVMHLDDRDYKIAEQKKLIFYDFPKSAHLLLSFPFSEVDVYMIAEDLINLARLNSLRKALKIAEN